MYSYKRCVVEFRVSGVNEQFFRWWGTRSRFLALECYTMIMGIRHALTIIFYPPPTTAPKKLLTILGKKERNQLIEKIEKICSSINYLFIFFCIFEWPLHSLYRPVTRGHFTYTCNKLQIG